MREEELPVVFLGKFHGDVLSVGGRTLPDVHGHIQNRTFHAAYQLALCIWRSLEMEPPHHTIRRQRLIVLYKFHVADFLVELSLRETFEEISARVPENFRLNDINALEFRLYHIHFFNSYCVRNKYNNYIR